MDLPIDRYGHDALTPRVWQLLENFSACDATYVALAEAIDHGGRRPAVDGGRQARPRDRNAHSVRVVLAD